MLSLIGQQLLVFGRVYESEISGNCGAGLVTVGLRFFFGKSNFLRSSHSRNIVRSEGVPIPSLSMTVLAVAQCINVFPNH